MVAIGRPLSIDKSGDLCDNGENFSNERIFPMKYKIPVLLLVFVLLFSLCGCGDVVGEIAGNVADAAAEELEFQIKKTVEEYKVDVVEIKSAIGKLNNGTDSSQQFFFGVLVRSNSDVLPQSIASAFGKVFDEAGCHRWTKSEIDNDHLVNKKISFKHTDFSTGDYYLIWGYTPSLTGKLTDKLSELELPTIPENWLPTASSN